MYWANFLHIYQPANQQKLILDAVTVECYRPLLNGIKNNPQAKITLNINASLVELFYKHGYTDLIDLLKELGNSGQIEFTGSAKFHAFLPLLPRDEIIRQIKLNDETNKKYLGDAYKPIGFFSPEMGYSDTVASVVEELGFKWMILDEITAYGSTDKVDYTKIYKIKNKKLNIFFRERRVSNLIMSAIVRSSESLEEAMIDDLKSSKYLVTAMDGETFGHHRIGHEKILFEIFKSNHFKLLNISELFKYYSEVVEIEPVESTWASSKQDIDLGIQFLSWHDPENTIHKWQWELIKLALNHVEKLRHTDESYERARSSLDKALASDHLWWASAKPWWSVEMIEDGAFRLLDTLRQISDIDEGELIKASKLYENIVSTAFEWQRTGKIYEMMNHQKSILRIPFKDRTIGVGGAEVGVYEAILKLINEQEVKALNKKEYEKAILWRDASFKLENKLDIYDTVSAIDLLRLEISNEVVEKEIMKYKDRYKEIRGGQPEQRGS
jgi:hypothetical protein